MIAPFWEGKAYKGEFLASIKSFLNVELAAPYVVRSTTLDWMKSEMTAWFRRSKEMKIVSVNFSVSAFSLATTQISLAS